MRAPLVFLALSTAFAASIAVAQQHDHSRHQPPAATASAAASPSGDARKVVQFPRQMREHTLANMRDHLLALQEIQEALARGSFDAAADVAETRLGMSSLDRHDASHVARYMPKGMQDIGTAMHRSASRFAIASRDAAATGDMRAPLAALATVTANCVACHAGYKLK